MMPKIFKYYQLMIVIICIVCISQPLWGQPQKTPQEMPPKVSEEVAPVTVKIICNPGKIPGSGVIIGIASTVEGDYPLILTACHVITSNYEADPNIALEYYADIQISIASQITPVPAKVYPNLIDQLNDIAVITTQEPVKVDKVISYKTKVSLGQKVAAFGFPQTEKLSQTVGIINREEGNYYVFDAGISGGYSGGPLVDDKGRMVGMTVFKAENAEGYAIKINLVATVVNNWLGDKPFKAFWQKEGDGSVLPYVLAPLGAGAIVLGIWRPWESDGTIPTFGRPPNPPEGQ